MFLFLRYCKVGNVLLNGFKRLRNELIFFINPKSGAGKARDIFQNKVEPLAKQAELTYDHYETRARNDAREYIKHSNVLKWRKGIVAVGGDGVLFEIINGIMERPDWKYIINSIPLAIIPGGSGNGLAKSLSVYSKEPYDKNPVLISTLNVIKGYPMPIDLVRIETHSEVVFSFLSFGWGLIADIDIESERLRLLGSPRFTIWSIARLIGLKTYMGRLSFLRVPPEELQNISTANRTFANCNSRRFVDINLQDQDDLFQQKLYSNNSKADRNSNSSFDMESISLDTGSIQHNKEAGARTDSFYSVNSLRSNYQSDKASSYCSLPEITKTTTKTVYGPSSQIPSINKPVPRSWEVYQGEFVLIHASYQSHLAEDVFFAPNCKPNDGIIWLLVIKTGISRVHLLQFLLSLSDGTHLKYPQVEMIPTLAFRLEPMSKGSHIVVDGEVLERSPIVQAEIFPGLVSLLSKDAPPVD